MAKLTVLYDEDCGFCTRLAARLARGPRIEAEPIGSAAGAVFLRDVEPAQRYSAVHVVDRLGRRWTGGAALPPLLRELPGGAPAAAVGEAFPRLAEWLYRIAARRRRLIAKLTRI